MGNYVLAGAIKAVRKHMQGGDGLLKKFLDDMEAIRSKLQREGNLLIHDPGKGGVLRGNYPTRTYELPKPTDARQIASPRADMGDMPKETAFSRAVFNLPGHVLRVREGDRVRDVRLVAYEAPLLRKAHSDGNDGLSDRAVRCDLVGVVDDEIWAIEVKTHVSDSTDIAYGMLEAYAYGHLLAKHMGSRDFAKELDLCRRHFHPGVPALPDPKRVRCFVGAPRSYINQYLGKGPDMTEEKARRRLVEARVVELLMNHSTRKTPQWGGFIVFDHGPAKLVSDPIPDKEALLVPRFADPAASVTLCPRTHDLESPVS